MHTINPRFLSPTPQGGAGNLTPPPDGQLVFEASTKYYSEVLVCFAIGCPTSPGVMDESGEQV